MESVLKFKILKKVDPICKLYASSVVSSSGQELVFKTEDVYLRYRG